MSTLVRLSARRFEQSPYFDCYASPESVLGVAAGRYYESANGQDPLETYCKLRKEAVLYDVPEKPWQIEGPDAVPFLERVLARRIDNPADWTGRTLAVETEGGLTAPCAIVELPFYDIEKRIPRGLEI
jgi:glycine cleavage system aminomethyltransferase T